MFISGVKCVGVKQAYIVVSDAAGTTLRGGHRVGNTMYKSLEATRILGGIQVFSADLVKNFAGMKRFASVWFPWVSGVLVGPADMQAALERCFALGCGVDGRWVETTRAE